jgi:hypothetical protein
MVKIAICNESVVNDHDIESCAAPHNQQQESFFCCRRCLSGTYNATAGDPASDNNSRSFAFSFTFHYDGSGSFFKSEVGDRNTDLSNESKGQWSVSSDGIVTFSASDELIKFKVCCDNNLEVMPVTIGLFGCPAMTLQKSVVHVPKHYQSISISNMFKLVDHIKSEIDSDTMQAIISRHKRGAACQNSIDSDFLKIYFERSSIYPPHEYEGFFSEAPARAVLSYQWTLDFRKIKAFLCASNLYEHNLTYDQGFSDFIRLLIHLFVWGWLWGHQNSQSLYENSTIWIDILFNNQLQKQNFPAILEKADYEYMSRPIHIALSTDQLLSRVWIINEFAKRKQAGKKTALVTAGGSEGKRIQQLQRKWTCSCSRGQNIEYDYFENLQATVEEDKIRIRENLLKLYGTKDDFNREIRSLVKSMDFDLMAHSLFVILMIVYVFVTVYLTIVVWIWAGRLRGVMNDSSEVMKSTFLNDSHRNVSIQSSNATQFNETSTPETKNSLGKTSGSTRPHDILPILLRFLTVAKMNLLSFQE